MGSVATINYYALIAGMAYVGAGIKSYQAESIAMALMWFFYAAANVCLVYVEAHAIH